MPMTVTPFQVGYLRAFQGLEFLDLRWAAVQVRPQLDGLSRNEVVVDKEWVIGNSDKEWLMEDRPFILSRKIVQEAETLTTFI